MKLEAISDLKGKKVTVMGLGLNGGGFAATVFLAEAGACVTVTDLRSEEELAPTLEKLQFLSEKGIFIKYVLGKHEEADFVNADIVIRNPAIRRVNKFLALAKWVETDISLFLRFVKNPIIAVTGSKGKSTCVSALNHILKETTPLSFLGGNITVSPLSFLQEALANPQAPVVLELSSWQLADLNSVQEASKTVLLKPKVAVITNIMNDHQNHYDSFDDYVCDKELIFKKMDASDTLIVPKNEWGGRFAGKSKATTLFLNETPVEKNVYIEEKGSLYLNSGNLCGFYSEMGCEPVQLVPQSVTLLGLHSRLNLLFAAASAYFYGIKPSEILNPVAEFKGIAYRMELVNTSEIETATGITRIKWINDSAATMPDAMLASAKSFTDNVYLITGGTDKCLEFDAYAQLPSEVKGVFLLAGTATEKLTEFLPKRYTEREPFQSLKGAVEAAVARIKEDAPTTAVLLLSPGAASFGMFKNEFDRGNQFIDLAKKF